MKASTEPTRHPSGALFYLGVLGALLGFGLFFDRAASRAAPQAETVAAQHAELTRDSASREVLQMSRWAVNSGDHSDLPFLVIDKAHARLFAFDATGRLRASTPVLLSAVRSDAAVSHATPAGRFVGDTWRSTRGDGIVWANSNAAVSLHSALSAGAPGRAEKRLSSGTVDDKRISDGSMHVADDFYRKYLGALRSRSSIAYVLPETAQGAVASSENGRLAPPRIIARAGAGQG